MRVFRELRRYFRYNRFRLFFTVALLVLFAAVLVKCAEYVPTLPGGFF